MKKNMNIILLGLICCLFAFGGLVEAQSTGLYSSYANSIILGPSAFGYMLGSNISINAVSSTSVTISSPVILDESSKDVKKYVLWYGPHSISNLINGSLDISIDDFKPKEFVYQSLTGTNLTMNLGTADGLVPSQIYYAAVVPISDNGDWGQMSLDVCFKLQGGLYAEGLDCPSLGAGTTHNSAEANMALANISNTYCNNQITLTWLPVSGATKVRIYKTFNTGQPDELIVEKAMSIGTHSYTSPNLTPPQVVKFVPVTANGTQSGTEHNYTLKLSGCPTSTPPTTPITPTTPTTPGVPKVPVVGPKQDIAYVLLISLFIYGIIRYSRYRRAKD